MNESVSEIVILQRVRNRVMEVFDLFSDGDDNLKSHSLIEFWADWVDSGKPADFVAPVFSAEEQECVAKVYESWSTLNSVAKTGLEVFIRRGLMSEEVKNA